MKRRSRMIRLCASFLALLLLASVFPVNAMLEQTFSDWIALDVETEGVVLQAEDGGCTVRVIAGDDAGLPEKAEIAVRKIDDTAAYMDRMTEKLEIDAKQIQFLRLFDISLQSEGAPVAPRAPVRVEIDLAVEGDCVRVLHFPSAAADKSAEPDRGEKRRLSASAPASLPADVLEPSVGEGMLSFETDSFSVFAVVGYQLEKDVLASDGHLYHITVTYGEDAGIPEGAELEVGEILQSPEASDETTEYERCTLVAQRALGWENRIVTYARFFDISIVDANGQTVQPAEGVLLQVAVTLADKADGIRPAVVHFAQQPEVLTAETAGDTVQFETDGFSVYAIVDAPEPVPQSGWTRVTSVEEIARLGAGGFCMRSYNGFYFTGEQYSINASRTGIRKTKPAAGNPDAAGGAATYYFEPVEGTDDQFRVYCLHGENRAYIRQSGNSLALTDEGGASAFTVSPFPGSANTFRMLGSGGYYWNMQGGDNGNGFAAYNNATDANARIQLEYYLHIEDDPYGLDGKSFGVAYNDNSAMAVGLTAQEKTVGGSARLAGQDMLIRPDVLDQDGVLLVAQNTDIPFWTFHNDHEDKYRISTSAEGGTKYLAISGGGITLTEDPAEASLFSAQPGTGANSGKWRFTSDSYSLNFAGSAGNGFSAATGSGASTWLNLVEKSVLTDEDFRLYTARKVSVSDHANVYDTQQVIIYTRVWNDTAKNYEFYAVNHDGTLIRCYDTGGGIQWIGSQVNTALWNFTEYSNSDGTPNYFYDLSNTQYGQYLVPQVTGGQVLSGSPAGINLNGRRYEENYTTIIAWDDANYAYAGLKAEGGRLAACPLSEAAHFYFAVVNPIDPNDHLTEVGTVDNNAYGITMRMIDFNNEIVDGRDSVQHAFFGSHANAYETGLLSTNLSGDYPTTTSKTGHVESLGNLFSGMQTVNHLFLQSVHNESGYFEYSSTQNFAHLNPNGNFTVYDQIAAIGTSSGPTRTHGQFMPYNEIYEGRYAVTTNQTGVSAGELPDTDPRKGEKLYLIPQNEADYFFGMELSASFTQTPSGLDAWGHDIIFEFSGDDDFWLYVDGELVLDLGGVRSALTGSVNFRTGVVKYAGTTTTLYEVYKKNYQDRGLSAGEISDKLNEIFTQNENGQYIFRDYSIHDMRIFYMERGAGASNLHMRFNLASVKPGTFILSKKLSGAEAADNSLIEFPYQICYKRRQDGESTWHLLTDRIGNSTDSVVYEGSSRPVRYRQSYTPAGGSEAYEHVFFLKPGEAAEVTLPEDATVYYVVECGVNPDIYEQVSANGTVLAGTDTANLVSGTARQDFATPEDTLKHRQEVEFDNRVQPDAMRTLEITKKLFDVDGTTPLHYPDNDSVFNFRLYLGNEDAEAGQLPPAFLYDYCVKDPAGSYCRWDTPLQRFVPLGKTSYAGLTDVEREQATFTTSMYGAISKIPADYTVEVRSLILGTQYRVEEFSSEIPRGYTLRSGDGYTRVDVSPAQTTGDVPYAGTIRRGENPEIEVRNQKGWGLTIKKVWTDSDFMERHDDIYFAAYVKTGTNPDTYSLYEDSVRRLKHPDTELYLFFDDLIYNGQPHIFSDFVIREVTLTGDISVDEDGAVTGYSSVIPAEEGGTYAVGGTPVGKAHQDFAYSVHYDYGEITGRNENVRNDTVTNSRPGLALYKTDLEGVNLSGAVFTLTDENGRHVALPSYTSGSDGLITIAYLVEGTYVLTETAAPKGYVVLDEPITVQVAADGSITLSPDSGLYELASDQADTMTAAVTIKNRTTGLAARKKSAITGQPLEGVHFALYRQVTQADGTKRKDYRPITGYEDLVTDENGIIPRITMELGPWTYYLTETQAAEGYELLEDDLCFTVGTDGTVTMDSHADWLSRTSVSGSVSYTITIPNGFLPEPASVTVSGTKVLRGRGMKAGEFTFLMTRIDADGAALGPGVVTSHRAGANGEAVPFSFPPLVYGLDDFLETGCRDRDGNALFYYVVEEIIPPGSDYPDIEFDTAQFLVVVRLSFDGTALTAEQAYYLYQGTVPADLRPVESPASFTAKE